MKKIPFSKPYLGDAEIKAISEVINGGWVVLGPMTKKFEEAFAKYVGAKYAVFVDSGTAALSLALIIAGYKKDFVTIPSLTFVSNAEVLYHAGYNIRFADIDRDTLCVELNYPELLPTNFAGKETGIKGKVIDSCHRIEKDDVKDSKSLYCYSFYATKNLNTIQGGMIALNSERAYKWLLMARDHGTTKGTAQRYNGKDPIYDVKFPGYRLKSDDMHAAIGLAQLKKLPKINKRRNEIVKRYNKNLGYNRKGNHLFPILVEKRKRFIEMMYDNGIQTSVHFRPIHTLTAYKQDVYLPMTDYIGPKICSLPLFPSMTNEEVDIVSQAVINTGLLIR